MVVGADVAPADDAGAGNEELARYAEAKGAAVGKGDWEIPVEAVAGAGRTCSVELEGAELGGGRVTGGVLVLRM